MDKKTYDKTLDREFRGRKVKTLVVLSNGWCKIPPGTVCTVTKKLGGLHLESDPCPHCGVRVSISYVPPKDVDFVDQGKIIALGQITPEIINSWSEKYEKRDGAFYCKKCGSQILQTTCYVSIHLRVFEPSCAGPGKVQQINYPFCPKCDGEIEYAQACFHVAGV